MNFYGTAAQVIPVLYLAMAFESRALYRQPDSYDSSNKDNPRSWNATQILLIVFIALLMTVGEVAALFGLYHDLKHPMLNVLVWYGLVAGLAGIFQPVMSHQWQLYKRHRAAGGGSGGIVALSVLCLIALSWLAGTFFF